MSATPAQSRQHCRDTPTAEASSAEARAPLCFVVDADASIRHFLSLILHGAGIDTEEFPDGQALRPALTPAPADARLPQHRARIRPTPSNASSRSAQRGLYRLRAAHEQPRLGGARARQEHRRAAPLAHAAGAQEAVRDRRDRENPAGSQARRSAGGRRPHRSREALRNSWIEFWYQPKIDLRKKQLVGAEAFARARHPQIRRADARRLHARRQRGRPGHAVRTGAATGAASRASISAKLGVNLRLAVNIPVNALVKLAGGRDRAELPAASSKNGRA